MDGWVGRREGSPRATPMRVRMFGEHRSSGRTWKRQRILGFMSMAEMIVLDERRVVGMYVVPVRHGSHVKGMGFGNLVERFPVLAAVNELKALRRTVHALCAEPNAIRGDRLCVVGSAGLVWLIPDLVWLNIAAQVMNALLFPVVVGFLVALGSRRRPRRTVCAARTCGRWSVFRLRCPQALTRR
jgi:hypothetical protein